MLGANQGPGPVPAAMVRWATLPIILFFFKDIYDRLVILQVGAFSLKGEIDGRSPDGHGRTGPDAPGDFANPEWPGRRDSAEFHSPLSIYGEFPQATYLYKL